MSPIHTLPMSAWKGPFMDVEHGFSLPLLLQFMAYLTSCFGAFSGV